MHNEAEIHSHRKYVTISRPICNIVGLTLPHFLLLDLIEVFGGKNSDDDDFFIIEGETSNSEVKP